MTSDKPLPPVGRYARQTAYAPLGPEGQRRLYAIRPEGLASLEDFLAELWPAALRRLKEAVEADHAG